MAILTNIFFWLFLAALVGAFFCWKLASSFRDKAAFADFPDDQEKFGARTKIFFTLFVFLVIAAILSAGLLIFQLVRSAGGNPLEETISFSTLTPTLTATPDTPTPTATRDAPQTATPRPSLTPSPTVDALPTMYIGNTNFQGVNLREEPSASGRILAKLINATVVYLLDEPTVQADGYTWQKVRLEDGTEGWVANIFLVTELIFPSRTP
jgi:hypothetical protein